LEVEDYARGIDPGPRGSRVGLSSVRERAEDLGTTEVMEASFEAGVGIEMGVERRGGERLGAFGFGRVGHPDFGPAGEFQIRDSKNRAAALGLAEKIHGTLDRFGLRAPRLQHGDGKVVWCSSRMRSAGARHSHRPRGHAAGAEGKRTASNKPLVRAACELGAGTA
jgi:hypothetical protein